MSQRNRIIDIKRTESSPTEPLTLTEVKAHLLISFTDDDTLLTSLITQARKAIENYCKVSIVAQTVTMTADLFQEWELPYGPVTGIQGVATRSGTEGSGPASYETVTDGWGTDGEEFLSFDPTGATSSQIFSCATNTPNRFKIIYTTGYNPVPDDLALAVLNEIAYRYENRGNQDLSTAYSPAAKAIAQPYQRMLWF